MDGKKLTKNIGIVGCGYWGKNLVRNMAELGALHTLCDTNTETLAKLKAVYPDARAVSVFSELLMNHEIDAVVIATNAPFHYTMTKEALLAGKDVFVEKPLALRAKEAAELVSLATEKNLILMVGHILRYHPGVIKIKEFIDKGELGKIYYVYSTRLNLGQFRKEENILWSFAPHDISAIMYLLNEIPVEVTTCGGNYLHQDIADVTLTFMSFRSGVKSHIFTSWLHPYKEQRLVIVGDKKMIVFDDTSKKDKVLLYNHKIDWINRMPTPKREEAVPVDIPLEEPLKVECKHFLECITDRQVPKTDGSEGLRVLEVLEACLESLNRNGAVCAVGGIKGERFFAHETAIVSDDSTIGSGTKIWHFSHVMPGASIGKSCTIGQNVFVASNVKIGNNVKIQNNVSVFEGVTLEDDVFCGPSMVFTNITNPRSHISRRNKYKKTLVQKGATIGANATIICGNNIGKYALVGAGAVVTRDVPDYALVLGVPATICGWVCECGEKLGFGSKLAKCSECGETYSKEGEKVVKLNNTQGVSCTQKDSIYEHPPL